MRLGIQAPQEVSIHRQEVYRRIEGATAAVSRHTICVGFGRQPGRPQGVVRPGVGPLDKPIMPEAIADIQSPVPPPSTDEQLLIRYRDVEDVAAFEELVRRYEKPLYNYLLRYLHSPSLAEDVFQVTFLRVHEKSRQFTEDRLVRPWLYSIATHAAIDALRKEGRRPSVSLDTGRAEGDEDVGTLLNLIQAHVPSPLEQMEEGERAAWTRQAIDALPEHLRTIILLAYFQGLKLQEVAEILQLPVGTVKSRLHKALVTLHTAWQRNHAVGA
ncbi:MAG: sigma-70 family RNA polymerase sigma factor [Planctomycetes bacterium]|nr:sigma-70 family RNA polymerase sigma factor [Planctomycetota bacterium]